MDTEYDDDPFCRFCLRQSQSSFPIFMDADPDLAKDVMTCLQIKVYYTIRLILGLFSFILTRFVFRRTDFAGLRGSETYL